MKHASQRNVFARSGTESKRDQFIISCILNSAQSHGHLVNSPQIPEDLTFVLYRTDTDTSMMGPGQNVAMVATPALDLIQNDTFEKFDLVVVPSHEVRATLTNCKAKCIVDIPPVDAEFGDESQLKTVDWLDWESKDYHIYTYVPEYDIPIIAKLLRTYFNSFRSTDPVNLMIRATGNPDDVHDAVTYALEECDLPNTHRPRYKVAMGDWGHREQLALSHWGDCCILPWYGSRIPLEAVFSMTLGNFTVATPWSAGHVLTPRSGTLLNSEYSDGYVEVDWDQVGSILKIAAANGKRMRFPAIESSSQFLLENSDFLKNIFTNTPA